jgi:outer membrane lipoprotein-sorting protein
MRTLFVLSLTLISMVSAVGSQLFPDARQLLEREAVALEGYDSYRFEERTTISGFPGTPDLEIESRVSGKPPGRKRMEMHMAGSGLAGRGDTIGGAGFGGCGGDVSEGGGIVGCSSRTQLLVSDGQHTWVAPGEGRQYMRLRGNASDLMAGVDPMAHVTQQAVASAKVLRSETIQIGGTPHTCWVIESREARMAVNGMQLRDVVITTWIDQKLGVSVRRTLAATGESRRAGSGGANEVQMQSEKRTLTVNEPLDDALFIFTPPAGATEIDLSGDSGR